MEAYCLVHLGGRRDSYKVTGQPKNIKSASTPTHITQDLMYHYAVMVAHGILFYMCYLIGAVGKM